MVSRSDSESHALLTACALPRGRETTPGVTDVTKAPRRLVTRVEVERTAGYPWRDPSRDRCWPRSLSMQQWDELRCWSGTALPFSTMATSGWRKHAANVCGSFRRREGKCPMLTWNVCIRYRQRCARATGRNSFVVTPRHDGAKSGQIRSTEETQMKVIRGDLVMLALDGRFEVIIHGCNCQCAMGAGIAKTIKEAF